MPAAAVTDDAWLSAQLAATGTLYRTGDQEVRGVLWWYSVSSVLLGACVDPLVRTGVAVDPGPAHCTLYVHPDGRVLDARSTRVAGDGVTVLGPLLADALGVAIDAVARLSGARARALWAIATDSLANRMLWAGASEALTSELARAVGPALPAPRWVEVGGRTVVRRASCCLIYLTPGNAKCASCPRQRPEERRRRLQGG
ncbi:(2Fe-2S)-binding protein [Labedaea rhizosphaerae]|uniref:FhuF-like iron-sulfur protein n=1 Tax=Labedaea rhizosphaerae TaxID=598644 RepID=A0A4R6SCL5_LABRH|nr:(2Fe-2S)-binding protein [Labedaea rhizosphaerae]TDP97394.1 FhuF-like iron-sulfur protein [Labedaea rhizosphaerae]